MNLIHIADLLVEKIKQDYKDDIAIVALCGSFIYNDTHEKSDLDFYFIPKTNRGYEMAHTFILGGIGFDFWGMSWGHAKSLATYNGTNTSIITKAQVIYHATQEDLDKFNALRNITLSPTEFRKKATRQAQVCQALLLELFAVKGNLSRAKQKAIDILYFAAFATALFNQTYIERGGRNLLGEVLAMPLVPHDFEALYLKTIHSKHTDELAAAAQAIIINLCNLLQIKPKPKASLYLRHLVENRKPKPAKISQGWYEEFKSLYNKLLRECETNNPQGIALAIARMDYEVTQTLTAAGNSFATFPDLFAIWHTQDLPALVQAVNTHEAMLIGILKQAQVPIIQYDNLDELAQKLRNLSA